MGDSLRISNSGKSLEGRVIGCKKQSISHPMVSASKGLSHKTLKCVTAMKQGLQGNAVAGDILVFLATTAALEFLRRFSMAKCPFIWRALQALQVFCYPPFKWIERWFPFNGFIKHTKKLSRPMLVLSIATLFSDEPTFPSEGSNGFSEIQESSGSRNAPSHETPSMDMRSDDEHSGARTSEKWLLDLHKELKRQGLTITERLSDDELRRFYATVNGDFSKLLSSVKKTIRWRQSYELFSLQELEPWSHLIFWHGHDVKQRPCLIIRLGLACSNLGSNDRHLIAKAVVSQIEHGILNLVSADQSQIMVLMDCQGLSPFGFPIQMMRYCAILLQDHYPNRLGCLIIIRLPQLARLITQTLFQVLKPATQRKVRVVGGNYQNILSECLQLIPSFLGGNCLCSKCSNNGSVQHPVGEFTVGEHMDNDSTDANHFPPSITEERAVGDHMDNDSTDANHFPPSTTEEREDMKKTFIVAVLMVWVFVLFIVGMHSEKLSRSYWQNSS